MGQACGETAAVASRVLLAKAAPCLPPPLSSSSAAGGSAAAVGTAGGTAAAGGTTVGGVVAAATAGGSAASASSLPPPLCLPLPRPCRRRRGRASEGSSLAYTAPHGAACITHALCRGGCACLATLVAPGRGGRAAQSVLRASVHLAFGILCGHLGCLRKRRRRRRRDCWRRWRQDCWRRWRRDRHRCRRLLLRVALAAHASPLLAAPLAARIVVVFLCKLVGDRRGRCGRGRGNGDGRRRRRRGSHGRRGRQRGGGGCCRGGCGDGDPELLARDNACRAHGGGLKRVARHAE